MEEVEAGPKHPAGGGIGARKVNMRYCSVRAVPWQGGPHSISPAHITIITASAMHGSRWIFENGRSSRLRCLSTLYEDGYIQSWRHEFPMFLSCICHGMTWHSYSYAF